METDLIKIKNISKEKEDENWNFRTLLKSYDNRNLDSIVHNLFKQISESIDCTTCGNCCKEIRPIVFNVYEALKNELKSDYENFQDKMDEPGYY